MKLSCHTHVYMYLSPVNVLSLIELCKLFGFFVQKRNPGSFNIVVGGIPNWWANGGQWRAFLSLNAFNLACMHACCGWNHTKYIRLAVTVYSWWSYARSNGRESVELSCTLDEAMLGLKRKGQRNPPCTLAGAMLAWTEGGQWNPSLSRKLWGHLR